MLRHIQTYSWLDRLAPLIVGALLCTACSQGATVPGGSPTAPPASVAAPTASFCGLNQARTVTLADDGGTVSVRVCEPIALSLSQPSGSDPWDVIPPDARILMPIPNPAAASVGVTLRAYQAVGPGTTTIAAQSRPHCDPGKVCPQVIRAFRVTVTVSP